MENFSGDGAAWVPAVPLVSLIDPAKGGLDGPLNAAAKSLANQAAYLKAQQEILAQQRSGGFLKRTMVRGPLYYTTTSRSQQDFFTFNYQVKSDVPVHLLIHAAAQVNVKHTSGSGNCVSYLGVTLGASKVYGTQISFTEPAAVYPLDASIDPNAMVLAAGQSDWAAWGMPMDPSIWNYNAAPKVPFVKNQTVDVGLYCNIAPSPISDPGIITLETSRIIVSEIAAIV